MQVVHELGHICAAYFAGAQVENVVLHPLAISQTQVSDNSHPLVVVWLGPIVGVVLPLVAFAIAKAMKSPGVYLFRFFAGFCLIANGVYIAFGPGEGGADTGVMMHHGSPRWLMVLFGVACAAGGLSLWNGLGRYFGLGEAKGKVDKNATVVVASLLLATIVLELLVSWM